MAFLIGGANSAADDAYEISNSCRFNRPDNSILSLNIGSDGDRRQCTISMWVKKSHPTERQMMFYQGDDNGNSEYVGLEFNSEARLNFFAYQGEATVMLQRSSALFRDPSAWYHIVANIDTDQGTAADRANIYVNGTQITDFSATAVYPDQNTDLNIGNNADDYIIGGAAFNKTFDGYISEVYYIDGTQYAASAFGETNDDGIWIPKEAKDDVTFGTNGFFLEFKNSAVGSGTSSTIGADTSGEDNHLTSTNVAVTDQSTDTPTNNFATLNSINPTESNASFSEGNLKFTNTLNSSPHHGLAHGTMAVAKGKWYWEVRVDAIGGTAMGIGAEEVSAFGKNNVAGNQGISLFNHGYTHQRGSDVAVSGGTTYTTNDIIGVALDMDNRKIYFHKDGTYFNSGDPTSGATGTGAISFNAADVTMTPAVSNYNSGICNVNFGNPAWTVSSTQADDDGYGNFEFDVPAGFYALCTKNLAEYG